MSTEVPKTLGGVGMRTETKADCDKLLKFGGSLLGQHNHFCVVTKDGMNESWSGI